MIKHSEMWNKAVKDTIELIFDAMPMEKRKVLENACIRNGLLTSWYGLEHWELTVYKEGFYIHGDGCRCSFSAWAKDDDGTLIFGRKPKESTLHMLWGTIPDMNGFDFNTFKFRK